MIKRLGLIWVMLLLALPLTVQAQDFWRVTFYSDLELTVEAGRTEVPTLNLNFTANPDILPARLDPNLFSMRAQTSRNFAEGNYEFKLGSNDGVRLYVDGQIYLNNFVSREFVAGDDTVLIFLSEGFHTISVEYYQQGGAAQLAVEWQRVSGAAPAVESRLAVPGGQVAMGQVLNVDGLSVRSAPYLGGSRLDIIEPGRMYPVYARNTREGVYNWYLIEIQEFIEVTGGDGQVTEQPAGDSIIGWVSGRYFLIDKSEEQVPIISSPVEANVSSPSTGVVGISRSNIRLRQYPSTRTPTLQILDWGAEFEILSRTIQTKENYWYQVNYQGQIGWLAAPYITVKGDINVVPQY